MGWSKKSNGRAFVLLFLLTKLIFLCYNTTIKRKE
uniref:Uncharacterized protein n=1 Tax=Siphoviridae sp. ctZHD14 TaxID=2827891 RepID=A0A8S5SWA0_9CAUD|nr:MAG TPA: hypothetical protein [Siphoviridae sp. ctZHD14]